MDTYRQRLADVIDLLREGLLAPVLAEFVLRYGSDAMREINEALSTPAHKSALGDLNDAYAALDAHSLLNLMIRRWKSVFESKLGQRERAFVSEMNEARVAWAHQKPVTRDSVLRAADTAHLLLEAVGAPAQAAAAKAVYTELVRQRFADTGHSPARAETERLPSWRDIVQPRAEVLNGRLAASDFAADLESVVRGRARMDEADPLHFFARTVVTGGLAALLASLLRRLGGLGGQPVIQLQTGYGGGKTHALMAAYHLAGGGVGLAHVPDGGVIRALAPDTPNRITAHRAAITGTAFDPATPRVYPDATTATLWGEIAYQLGGAEAYAAVARADSLGLAPGAETWLGLFDRLGACLIVLDELTAFGRNIFHAREGDLPAGTFASLQTGLQALTGAVSRSANAQLLVTLPQAGSEASENGQRTYTALADIFGRVDTLWSPVTPDESGLIARRRLFENDVLPARDATVDAFRAMMAATPDAFPRHAGETDYALRLYDTFPLHPELADRLYSGWGRLDRFQRTRGVLKTLALAVGTLWAHRDPAPLILPAGLPLYDPLVRDELTGKLPLHGRWDDLVRREIDGEDAAAFLLGRADPLIGRTFTHRRLARALFFGTAPLTDADRPRGLTLPDLRLGAANPNDPDGHFPRALAHLVKRLGHLKSDDEYYWLSLNR